MSVDWDFAAAAASAAEARRLAPLAFLGNYVSARLSLSLGRTAQAVTWLRKAIDADPIETNAAELLSYALMCAGHGGAAHEAALRPMSLEPESAVSQIFYCWIEATVGDPLRACHAGAAAHRKLSESPAVAAMYAYALARKGARAESAHLLEWTQARGANEYGCDSLASICWLALGERSAALAALQRALQARCCWLPMMLRDPRNAALFGDVEFENLLLQVFGRRSKRVPPRSATVSIGPRSHSQVSGGFSESLS